MTVPRILLLGDSLAFHGPARPELLTEPGLYPHVLAGELGAEVDVVARLGWTARDAWWALTKDPHVYSVLLPRAAGVVLAGGGSDSLPASLPTYLKDGIAYLRPGGLRRAVRAAYHRAHPRVVRLLDGRVRTLPQRATDTYLARCVEGIRQLRPGLPIVGIVPPPYDSPYHGHVTRLHPPAAEAARRWGLRMGVPMVDTVPLVAPALAAGTLNPDGMHWSWEVHAEVGRALADAMRAAGWSAAAGNRGAAGNVQPSCPYTSRPFTAGPRCRSWPRPGHSPAPSPWRAAPAVATSAIWGRAGRRRAPAGSGCRVRRAAGRAAGRRRRPG